MHYAVHMAHQGDLRTCVSLSALILYAYMQLTIQKVGHIVHLAWLVVSTHPPQSTLHNTGPRTVNDDPAAFARVVLRDLLPRHDLSL